MTRPLPESLFFLILLGLLALDGRSEDVVPRPRLPEFTTADRANWINSPPLRRDDLVGEVVMVDVWTYECWNCYRSFPWLKALERRFEGRGFRVIGIHSPEFDRERELDRVRAKIDEFGLTHPVMIDNDLDYWRALGNRYWPAFYLVDRKGRVREVFVGETHVGDAQAARIERRIEALLAE
ncbi:MAG: redoxin family protein [Gammaproteobacteria bacterium]